MILRHGHWAAGVTLTLVLSMASVAAATGHDFAGAEAKHLAPGIWRIVDDGTGYDMGRIQHIAADEEGTIWVAGHKRLSRVGEAGAIKKPFRVFNVYDLAPLPGGGVLVEGVSMAAFDGGSWTKLWSEPRRPQEYRSIRTIASDGSIWAASGLPDQGGVGRWDGRTWADRAHDCFCSASGVAETPDGIWMGVAGTAGLQGFSGTGLFRLDGDLESDQWVEVRPFADERNEVADLAAGADGALWASLLPEDAGDADRPDYSRAHLARWDGATWTSYAWPARLLARLDALPWNTGAHGYHPTLSPGMQAALDGRLWFKKPLMSFDGRIWVRYAIPHRKRNERPRLLDFDIAPDGRLWLVVRDFTKWGRGEPDGIYALDPEAAEPIAVEQTVVRAE